MPNIPLVSLGMIVGVAIGAAFGSGFMLGHGTVALAFSDPFKYCFHLNLTTDSSLIPPSIRPFVLPGVYAICKVG